MKTRVDEAISQVWLQAGADLGIRVTAPFTLHVSDLEAITFEAHVLDFGGPRGTVTGVLDDKLGDCRFVQGYYGSNLFLFPYSFSARRRKRFP